MKTFFSSTIILVISLFFLVRRSSPIFFWIILELNLIFVLFIIFEDIASIKAIICYFIFQVYGRLLFIYGFIRTDLIIVSFLGLAVKFGFFPFHVWQPYVFNFSNWKTCLIIAGPQKAFLILLFTFFNIKINDFIIMIIITTISIANIYLLFLYDLKKTFSFLSIGRASWLLFLIRWSLENNIWYLYLYNIQLFFMFLVFYIREVFILENKKYLNMMVLIFIIRYSGIPPIIGFFIKLQILRFFFFFYQNIIYLLIMSIIMIPSTFFLVYYRITFLLKKKLIMINHTSLFYLRVSLTIFVLPSFFIYI